MTRVHAWSKATVGMSLLAWALLACAGSPRPSRTTTEAAAHETPRSWRAPLDRDHALVGRVWDVRRGVFVSQAELGEQLSQAKAIVIGERHDHEDHHLLQTELLRSVVAAGRKPAVVFEMLEQGQEATIERSLAAHPGDADALASAVAWEGSGWPAWALYRPLFAAALSQRLPIVAAGIDRPAAMRVAREGVAALDGELVRKLGLAEPLPETELAPLTQEMSEAHCGLLPAAMLEPMVLVQRARDALLAERAGQAVADAGAAVVIAGNGHARSDRGVPALLRRALGITAVSVGLLEVEAALTEPSRYAESFGTTRLPFDYVWFTPRQNDEDHCAKLRPSQAAPP